MFNAKRLVLARKRRGMSAKFLAEKASLSPVTITRIEKGNNDPEPETIKKLSTILGFSEAFFFGDDLDEIGIESASFRSLKAMTAKERDAALASGSIAFHFSDWVDQKFNLHELDVPDLKELQDQPEVAAKTVRQYWGLGEKPISHLIKLLESKGIRVFSLAENTKNVDAFSCWRAEQAYVFLNSMKTSERSRFDAAHELGHLVLHRYGGPQHKSAEHQANTFASAFLLPRADVISNVGRVNSIDKLVASKRRWGVSAIALCYRLHKIGLLSDWQYRTFCIQINQRYGRQEPQEMKREFSIVWEKVLRSLWVDGVTKKHISESIGVSFSDINELLFGLDASSDKQDVAECAPNKKATLRLVT